MDEKSKVWKNLPYYTTRTQRKNPGLPIAFVVRGATAPKRLHKTLLLQASHANLVMATSFGSNTFVQ